MSIEDLIADQLRKANVSFRAVESVEEAGVDTDRFGKPFHARDRLLKIFRGRLKGCRVYDPNGPMREFLEETVLKLERLEPSENIYFWNVSTDSGTLSGRSTSRELLHVFRQET